MIGDRGGEGTSSDRRVSTDFTDFERFISLAKCAAYGLSSAVVLARTRVFDRVGISALAGGSEVSDFPGNTD